MAEALFWNVSMCSSRARRNGSKTFLMAEATPELPYPRAIAALTRSKVRRTVSSHG